MHALFRILVWDVEICVAAIGAMHFSCVASAAHFFIYGGEEDTPDYKAMYFSLFNSVTDAIEILCEAQRKTEEIYITSSEKEDEKRKNIKLINSDE